MATVADEIIGIFAKRGESAYYGEDVSQLEHALQAAYSAQGEKATPAQIVAALVHDIGHLLEDIQEDIADAGIDARHEELGQHWLAARFGKNVFEPVYLHVSAKRYLCATESGYFEKLSSASVQSLGLQGGPMTPSEIAEFEGNEFYLEAVALRRWDDEAKIPGLRVPGIEAYRGLLSEVAKAT
jgi:phosphonate degradation associated HDIG domain protein